MITTKNETSETNVQKIDYLLNLRKYNNFPLKAINFYTDTQNSFHKIQIFPLIILMAVVWKIPPAYLVLSRSLKFMLSSAFSLPPTILAFVGRTGFGGAVSGGGFNFLRIGESRGCNG